jgi:ABC-type lipoprotein export system ATPase subunit
MSSDHPAKALQVRGLIKRFGVLQVLGPLNFELEAGEQIALTGASGSGKSTLLNLLGGIDDITEGEIILKSQNYRGQTADQLATLRLHQVGFVHQFFDLLSDLTALENVLLPLWLAHQPGAAHRARSLLDRLGLGHRLDQPAGVLSGGEQQRVAIARALALKPNLILADEPSGSLDQKNGIQVIELLMEQARVEKATLIVATHSQEAASRFSRRIHLRDGLQVQD